MSTPKKIEGRKPMEKEHTASAETPHPHHPPTLDYSSKLYTLFFKTKHFFPRVEHETRYLHVLTFFVLTSIVAFIVKLAILLPSTLENTGLASILSSSARSFIMSVLIAFLIPFILAGVVHLGVLMFRGQKGYFNTFKPITYILAIAVLYSLISFIVVTMYNAANPPDLQLLANIGGKIEAGAVSPSDFKPLFPQITIQLLFGIGSLVHACYAATLGISRFQNISKTKSFFSLMVFPLIFLVIFIAAVLFLTQIATQMASLP